MLSDGDELDVVPNREKMQGAAPGVVHVFGFPENDYGLSRPLVVGERLCTSPDQGESTVFHVAVEHVGFGDSGWICNACGRTTGEVV